MTFPDRKAFYKVKKKRRTVNYNNKDLNLIKEIKEKTKCFNVDNISRTKAYADFYDRNREIRWSFLASMVSRNAGWNMTDLEGDWFPLVLSKEKSKLLFLTYERANWLIFEDAYPQLLLYERSKQEGKALFHLLKAFHVSTFMELEWQAFWSLKQYDRLMTAQIINEQNVIQQPVIEHPIYKKKVFRSLPFKFQDWLHFSSVLLPTTNGELFGFSVHDFRNVNERILLGKKLATLLFHPSFYESFLEFSNLQEHTGSRFDYERFCKHPHRDTPFLRLRYPVVNHDRHLVKDWFDGRQPIKKWMKRTKRIDNFNITKWYEQKRKQLKAGILLYHIYNEGGPKSSGS